MGRKELPEELRREKPLRIRLTSGERSQIDFIARLENKTSSEWARAILLKASSKQDSRLETQQD